MVVAATILVAHAVAVFLLLSIGPRRQAAVEHPPVEVRFVSELPPSKRWQPPEVKTVAPQIVAPMPDVAFIEIPVLPASERAITVPVQAALVAPPPPSDSAPRLISVIEYLREPSLRYPPQSRRLREQGLVVLRVLVDEKGAASSIEIETSSGFSRLDHAAREAVSRAAFRPYVEGGAPRRAFVLIPIEFSLNRSAA
jgi:protein TonB